MLTERRRGGTRRASARLCGIAAGIHATSSDNRIEGNNCVGNDRGIQVDAGGNVVIRNSVAGPGAYTITGSQTIGPIITASGTISSTNPWANFTF